MNDKMSGRLQDRITAEKGYSTTEISSLKGKIFHNKESHEIIQSLKEDGFIFMGSDWRRKKTDEHSGGPYSTYEHASTKETITIEPHTKEKSKFC